MHGIYLWYKRKVVVPLLLSSPALEFQTKQQQKLTSDFSLYLALKMESGTGKYHANSPRYLGYYIEPA